MHTLIRFCFIHNWSHPQSFDADLFAIDREYRDYANGPVEYAERIFHIPAPHWLRRLVFGPECPKF